MEYSSLDSYLRSLPSRKTIGREEEIVLATKAQSGGPEGDLAMVEIIQNNLALVVRVAKNYTHMGIPIEDLVAEGNVGLMKAAQKFDTNAGFRLSTYATWWIKESIRTAICEQGRTIRIPRKTLSKISKVKKVIQHLSQLLGRTPSLEELEAETGIEKKTLEKLLRWDEQTISIHLETAQGEELGSSIPDESFEEPGTTSRTERDWLENLLNTIKPKEREILEARFGWNGHPQTLEEIGQTMGLTRERVRQIETSAIGKMKKRMAEKGITTFF